MSQIPPRDRTDDEQVDVAAPRRVAGRERTEDEGDVDGAGDEIKAKNGIHGSQQQKVTCQTCHPTDPSKYTCFECHPGGRGGGD